MQDARTLMKVSLRLTHLWFVLIAMLFSIASVQAQNTAPSAPTPKKPVSAPRASSSSAVNDKAAAPQVVTILHRLSGVKMLGLLMRGDQQMAAIAQLDDAFKILGDVHTNVIAGLALNDGQTIVARLPELEAELAPTTSYFSPNAFGGAAIPPGTPKEFRSPDVSGSDEFFQTPDVSVILSGGQEIVARYVGFDAVSGLCVLRVDDQAALPTTTEVKSPQVFVGQRLRLFGPEPTAASSFAGKISVKVGESEGMITNVTQAPSGGVYRFKVRAARLSPANIGSVAVNEAGDTVGIVVEIGRGEANILPATQIRSAARRVIQRQSSVPRPWLGVSGQPIAALQPDQLLNNGWLERQAVALTQARRGILLTNVLPDSPAAVAALHTGDVILTVNGDDIRTADDFSWHLEEAGPGGSVSFTVMRRGGNEPQDVNLKLSGALDWSFGFPRNVTPSAFLLRKSLLAAQGIDAIALKTQVATRLGARGGLLVISVQPESEASKAGLLPGDVIEAINGQRVSFAASTLIATSQNVRLDVVRVRQRFTITLAKARQ
jgi:S1-C subfamily serine protease